MKNTIATKFIPGDHIRAGMPESVTSPSSPVELIQSASDTERDIHRELVFNNIEFLIDVLTAAHAKIQRMDPVGCVGSTPAQLARSTTNTVRPAAMPPLSKKSLETKSTVLVVTRCITAMILSIS